MGRRVPLAVRVAQGVGGVEADRLYSALALWEIRNTIASEGRGFAGPRIELHPGMPG